MIKDIILHNLTIHRKDYLVELLRFTIGFVFLYAYTQWTYSNSPEGNTPFLRFSFIMIITGFVLGTVSLYEPFKEKSTSIMYSMLPASNIEKFIGGIIYNTFGKIVIIALAFLFADAIQALYSYLFSGYASSITLLTLTNIKNIILVNTKATYMVAIEGNLLLVLFFHAVLTLAGSYFRKYTFLLSVIYAFVLLFAIGLTISAIGGFNLVDGIIVTSGWIAKHDILSYIIFYGFIAFCYWKSYQRFCRKAIV